MKAKFIFNRLRPFGIFVILTLNLPIPFFSGTLGTLNCFSQNISINTDGAPAQTGVMLHVKGTKLKATTGFENIFQITSLDADPDEALKLRMGIQTHATAGSRYGLIDVADYTTGTPTYRNLALQPAGGFVGIGTTAPGVQLEIASEIRVGAVANAGFAYSRGSGDFYLGGENGQDGNLFIKNLAGTILISLNTNSGSYFNTGSGVGFGMTSPAAPIHSYGQIRTGIPLGGLGGASATTGSLLFYNLSNTNTVNIQSGVTSTGYTLTLPTAAPAANNYALTSTTGGVLSWQNMGDSQWSLLGNTGTTAGTNFIGTTDAQAWVIKTTNTERMRVLAGGSFGVGTTTPASNIKFQVAGDVSIMPGTAVTVVTYNIPLAQLTGQATVCVAGASYYGAAGTPGFTWTGTEPAGSAITALSIEVNIGMDCHAGGTLIPGSLNGTASGSFASVNGCACPARNNIYTYSPPVAAYVVGGANAFKMTSTADFGQCTNTGWAAGTYARVIVTYSQGNFGRLGIGTTSPISSLQIAGGDITMGQAGVGTTYGMVMNTTDGSDYSWLSLNGGGAKSNSARGAYMELMGNDIIACIPPDLGGCVILSTGRAEGGGLGEMYFRTDNAGTIGTRMMITNPGLVGIGTSAPATKLHVVEAGAVVGTFDRTTSDGVIINLQQDGTTEGTISVSGITVSYNAFTGSHYAWTETEQSLEKGMLVTLTGNNQYFHNNKNSEIIYGVQKSDQPNDAKIMGSFLGLQESNLPYSVENPNLIMAVGNGVMWVADKGENIQIGDYLISSDIPGHAMKDNGTYPTSFVIARVAEPVDWSAESNSINGVKHKLISVFFESFVRNNAEAELLKTKLEIADLKTENKNMKLDYDNRINKLEEILGTKVQK